MTTRPTAVEMREIAEQFEQEAARIVEIIHVGDPFRGEQWNERDAYVLAAHVLRCAAEDVESTEDAELAWLRAWHADVTKALDLPDGGKYRNDAIERIEMLRKDAEMAQEMREWMQMIYDFDDGAWAAGKHREAARKQGIETVRGFAGRALRGESVADFLGGTDDRR